MSRTKKCTIKGCDRQLNCHGFCSTHLKRWRLYGDPMARPRFDFDARFWEKVLKTDGCWLWQGSKTDLGYGHMMRNRHQFSAHRTAYESIKGPIPEGLVIDHLCRNPSCVNPDHLEPVTTRENSLRGIGPAAQNARKTHCIRGHPFDETNTYYVNSRRQCRACYRIRRRKYYHQKKQRRLTNDRSRTESLRGDSAESR